MLVNKQGAAIGKLAAKVSLESPIESVVVTGVMVRTKSRTDPKFVGSVRIERWEVPLAEVVVSPGQESKNTKA